MNTKNKLSLGMGLLFFITIILFGLIIINEKSNLILMPKINEKINSYIKVKYKDIYKDIKINDIKYDRLTSSYSVKINSKTNKNLYFYVNYKNKKITNTYKKDYIEGKTLLTYLENNLEKNISKSKTYTDVNIKFTRKLNKYSTLVQENIINNNMTDLSIYSVNCNTLVNTLTLDNISNSIIGFYNYIKKNNLNPKNYSLIITDKNDITNAIKINNLDEKLISNNLNEIISGIINKDKSIIEKYNITYKYMN